MIAPDKLYQELTFQTSRSGGKGGQNVNKTETKVELRFDVEHTQLLSAEQKWLLRKKLANRINADGILVLYHQTERSQLANKEMVTRKFFRLVAQALTTLPPRKATRPTKASVLAGRQAKSRHSTLKANRRRPALDE